MKIYSNALRTITKRLFIVVFFGTVTLLFLLANSLNPVFHLMAGLGKIKGNSFLDSIISLLQFLIEPRVIIALLLSLPGFSAVASLITGLLFSGCFYIINNTLNRIPKTRGEFGLGLKKYFWKVTLVSFFVFFTGLALAVFLSVASVPALVITSAARESKGNLIPAAIFVDVLTAGVFLFIIMFFTSYAFFTYPAIYNGKKGVLIRTRQVVDLHFWGIAGRFLILAVVFVLFQLAISQIAQKTISFIINWIFITAFGGFVTTYVFSLYKEYEANNKNTA